MTRIVITSVAQLKALNKKLRSLVVTLPTLQTKALERAANDVVLSDIHRDMESNNFSKKIIDATFVGPIELFNNGKKGIIHFISDYTSDDGFDVSNAREEGTRAHDVFPKKTDGVLRWVAKTGEVIFRKKSRTKGIQRLLLIEKNINKNQQSFSNSYDKQIVSFIKQVMRV